MDLISGEALISNLPRPARTGEQGAKAVAIPPAYSMARAAIFGAGFFVAARQRTGL
ncbi:MAG: hypothetical protein IPO76_00035 [Elusimicrobia bacterium]|nr:hypothetical protein [Elusimicrobiota bacterium]MBK7544536.1 hypothetical protein [Elusimicrobiota bacterium]MBK7574061.1 hypothetical protein [Elusimicrobiota bacterium]MBK7688992.1 hypothetical protein [Elusimicrobiota bacterium]MBK8126199.1 hypothetical protein [Elusimicrobiota bacterium]